MTRLPVYLLTGFCLLAMLPGRAATGAATQEPTPEIRALIARGEEAMKARRWDEALRWYAQAAVRARQVGDGAGEAWAYNDSAVIHLDQGRPQQALEYFLHALALHRQMRNTLRVAKTLRHLGVVYHRTGDVLKAQEHYRQGLALFRQVQDKDGQAKCLNGIGVIYDATSQPRKALEHHLQALPLYRQMQDKLGEAIAIYNIGSCYGDLGEQQKALAHFLQALPLHREVKDKAGEANTISNIGFVYQSTGQPEKALEYFQQSLRLRHEAQDRRGEAYALQNIGEVYAATGRPQQALEVYLRALPIRRAVSDRRGEAATLNHIGMAYHRMGQQQKALEHLLQALPLRRQVRDRQGEAHTVHNLGRVYEARGQPEKALEYYRQALPLRRQALDRQGEAATRDYIAYVHEQQGRSTEARQDLAAAVKLLDSLRGALGRLSGFRMAFQEQEVPVYHRYLDLLARGGDVLGAFEAAQKSKARNLLDLMAGSQAGLEEQLTARERQRLSQLREAAAELNSRRAAALVAGDQQQLAALEPQVARAERDLDSYTDELSASHPALAPLHATQPITPAALAAVLPADAALLEYVTLQARGLDRTLLFCLTTEGGQPRLELYPINQPRKELAALVEALRRTIVGRRADLATPARRLAEVLLQPADRQLADKKRLIVCPDGPLWELPFHALRVARGGAAPTEGRSSGETVYLLERGEVSYAYSATALASGLRLKQLPGRPRPTGTLLVFANPDFASGPAPAASTRDLVEGERAGLAPLPGTEAEAKALRTAFPTAEVLAGQAAQKSAALRQAARARFLHFATHGILNDAAPLQSAIVLAQRPLQPGEDGFLTARDILGLKLAADLVVLSACDSGRGEQKGGEGLVGLVWALFAAGSPSQVVSQWPVYDASTAELMGRFYQGLAAGKEKGAALREAQLDLLRQEQYRHPFYWAPFILVGDWR